MRASSVFILSSTGFAVSPPGIAAEPPPRPALVAPLAEYPDCPKTVEFTPGQKFVAPAWLVDSSGNVACRAVLEPYTSFADLLNIETSYNELRGLYRLDTLTLEVESAGWKQRAEWAEVKLAEPPIFFERPAVAMWVGRGEMLIMIGVSAWALHEVSRL